MKRAFIKKRTLPSITLLLLLVLSQRKKQIAHANYKLLFQKTIRFVLS